jgi:BlaI family transcriptional regulator, penicillinase repressor
MARKAKDVTDAELAILQILWDEGPISARTLAERLYPTEPDKQVPTVQKLLGRLEGKDCVTRDRSVWPHLHSALIARDELVGRRLTTAAEELCGGSFTPLLSYLVKGRPLSEDERSMLRGLLGELERDADESSEDKKRKKGRR